MWRETEKPNRLRFSWRWIMVMTRVPCAFSIARMACTRRNANQRPMSKGCSAMSGEDDPDHSREVEFHVPASGNGKSPAR